MEPSSIQGDQRSLFPSAAMRTTCGLIAIMAVGVVTFFPVLTAGFVSRDDAEFLGQASRVRLASWQDLADVFGRYQTPEGAAGTYQPLAILTLAADARLARGAQAPAFQFHLTNLLLHLINTALVFVLIRRLAGGTGWPLLWALLFGLHPIQVESVAWIAQRGTLLGMMFSLLAINIHLNEGHRWWRVLRVMALALLYLAALLSNPIYIGLPVFLLILDLWPLRRTSRLALLEVAPLLLIMGAGWAVQLAIQKVARPVLIPESDSLQMVGENLTSFWQRLVWPIRLSPYYPRLARAGTSFMAMMPIVATMVALAVLPIWALGRSRPLFFAITGAVVMLFTSLRDAPFTDELLGDHYLYTVMIAPLIALAVFVRQRDLTLQRPAGRLVALCGASLVLFFAVLSYSQTYVWQSNTEIFKYTTQLYPQWGRGYCGLVEAALRENDLDAALIHARKAVEVDPKDANTQFYLGTALLLQEDGRGRQAIAPLRRALDSNPNWIACLQNMGVALARAGELDKAIEHFERARDLNPESSAIRQGLGNAYLQVNRPASARRELEIALKDQNDPNTHLSLAMAWAAIDVPVMARRHLAVALAKQPRLAERAAQSETLRRACEATELESLLRDTASMPVDPAMDANWPTARSAKGS